MGSAGIDWAAMLIPEAPVEMIVRGAVLYIAFVVLFRVMPRRAGGELRAMDLVFLLLITEAASHALGEFTAIGDGLIMIVTMMALNFLLNWSSYHFRWMERLLSSPPVQVVRDGDLLRRAMRGEYLTESELMEYLRIEGIDDLAQVKSAFVESDGQLSVIKVQRAQ